MVSYKWLQKVYGWFLLAYFQLLTFSVFFQAVSNHLNF